MPRYSKHEPTIEDCLTIEIAKLREWGNLQPGESTFPRSYQWSVDGELIGSVTYEVKKISDDLKELNLSYRVNGNPICYKVPIVSKPSNLGIGKRWYFVCPRTGKRCMNLISPPGSNYFLHREAFNLQYDSQRKSKKYRELENMYGDGFKLERLYKELWTKYRKRHYQGKPTPLMQKIICLEKKLDRKQEPEMKAYRLHFVSL